MSLDVSSDSDAIPNFMVPFATKVSAINEQFRNLQDGAAPSEELMLVVMSVLYDITGALFCLESERKYVSFLESMFYIEFFETITEIVRVFISYPKVIIATLKFVNEIVDNKGMRIAKTNSSLGSRIFKFVSKVTNAVGTYIISNEGVFSKLPANEAYIRHYKQVSLIAKIAADLVNSNLVNFNAIELYKDPHCDKFCEILFTLIFITPAEEVASYIKRSKTIFMFLEILSKSYVTFFAKYPVETFSKVLDLVHDGIQSFDLTVSINSMDFISNLMGHLLNLNNDKANVSWALTLREYIAANSEKLQAILRTSFVMILNGEVSNYSYFAKMIFALIIIENTYFINLISELQTFYGTEKSPYLTECFHELSTKIGAKYSSNCRDKFKQSLESFAGKLLDLK